MNMENFRDSYITKVILLLVALSMGGLFGLGSITSMWGKKQDAIVVEHSVVKSQELVRQMDKDVRRAASMTGGTLTMKQAIQNGALQQKVQTTVDSLSFQLFADKMGLIASTDAVGNHIINNQAFQTITGAFDRSMFRAYLQQMQMSENEFIAALQEELARKHLTDAIDAVMATPDTLTNLMYRYTNEARDMDSVLIPLSSVRVEGKPDADTLQAYYDAMEDQLYAPEYRRVTVLKLTPDKVAAQIPVSDEDLKEMYDARQDVYATPETRRLQQVFLQDEQKAQTLYKELTSKNFEKLAKEKADQTDEQTNLGWVAKNGIATELGEIAFDAKIGEVLPPVQSEYGWHILIVRDIKAATQTPFEKVKDELKKTAQAEKAYDILYENSKKLDEALGEGKTLAQAAELIGLKVEDVGFIDASGADKKGQSVNLPVELVQELFMSKENEPSRLIDYQNGYLVGQVEAIEPVYLKPFDTVQDTLLAEWKSDMQKKNAPEFAQSVYNAALKDKSLKSVALFYHLEEKPLKDVRRVDMATMPADVVAQLFNAKAGAFELVKISDTDYAVVKVNKIIPADMEDSVEKRLLGYQLKQQTTAALTTEMLRDFQRQIKIVEDWDVINQAFEPYMRQSEQ